MYSELRAIPAYAPNTLVLKFAASIALACLTTRREAGSGQGVLSWESSESKEGLEAGIEGVAICEAGMWSGALGGGQQR